jgi:uncharacterized protein (UPF0332 family)
MTLKYAEEIAANLERAAISIAAAKDLTSGGYYDFATSRAYYAAFYAATALLLSEELEFARHSGVISAIHQRFVKTGALARRHGKDLNWLFEMRGIGDYGVTIHLSEQDARRAIRVAEDFLCTIQAMIEEAPG